jgi:hypothetical protein
MKQQQRSIHTQARTETATERENTLIKTLEHFVARLAYPHITHNIERMEGIGSERREERGAVR